VTAQRAHAYGQVMRTVRDDADAFEPAQRERLRAAADSLLFCQDLHADENARAALVDVEALARELVRRGWSEGRAGALVWDVIGCGPATPVLHRAA
jgi:hypothetical protein